MRILMVSQFWTPEPFFKALPFARELERRGHEVEVLTGFPNYPGGKIYPGYRLQLFQREMIEGIRVNRVWLYASHDTSARKRILNYISFAVSAVIWGPWITKRPDVIYVYHPPATAGIPARWLSLLKRAPVLFDIHDLWPDSVTSSGMFPQRLAKLLARFCALVHRRMNRLVVISPGLRRALIDRQIPAEKIDVIECWCDEEALRPVPRDSAMVRDLGFEGRFTILFAGTMGSAQGLDSVIEAARILDEAGDAVQFAFIGSGIERERLVAMSNGLPNVRFLDRRPIEEMPGVIAAADVVLAHLRDDPLFEITIPSKIQAYLYAGKPILLGVRGDGADLVQSAEAGVICEPGNPHSLVDAVRQLKGMSPEELALMGRRGAEYYAQRLSLKAGVDRFEALFEHMSRRRSTR